MLCFGPSNRGATALSPTVSNHCSGPWEIAVNFDVEIVSDSGFDLQTKSACTIRSSFPVAEKLK